MKTFTFCIMDSAIIWFIIGLVLIIAELAVPGVILVFIGIAAWIVAALNWAGLDSFQIQLWVFGLASLGGVIFARRYVKGWFSGNETVATGGVDEEFVGKIVNVISDIEVGGFGTVELKGAPWKAFSSSALLSGQQAEVIARSNITLKVKPRS